MEGISLDHGVSKMNASHHGKLESLTCHTLRSETPAATEPMIGSRNRNKLERISELIDTNTTVVSIFMQGLCMSASRTEGATTWFIVNMKTSQPAFLYVIETYREDICLTVECVSSWY